MGGLKGCKYMKLSLSETYFIKWIMKTFLDAENESKENKLLAQDILNKLNK